MGVGVYIRWFVTGVFLVRISQGVSGVEEFFNQELAGWNAFIARYPQCFKTFFLLLFLF